MLIASEKLLKFNKEISNGPQMSQVLNARWGFVNRQYGNKQHVRDARFRNGVFFRATLKSEIGLFQLIARSDDRNNRTRTN